MILKHLPYYSLTFPRKKTSIRPFNNEQTENIREILQSSDINFEKKHDHFVVKLNTISVIKKISEYINSNNNKSRNIVQLANLMKSDLKTASLVHSL